MRNKCITCGKNAEGLYCFLHKPRKALAKTKMSSFVSRNLDKSLDKSQNNSYQISEMREFFLLIWEKRKHYSEVSGDYLGKEPLTIFFHHILPKEKYPNASLDEENIILLTFDEHNNVENDMYKYDEVNLRRESLKLKYETLK